MFIREVGVDEGIDLGVFESRLFGGEMGEMLEKNFSNGFVDSKDKAIQPEDLTVLEVKGLLSMAFKVIMPKDLVHAGKWSIATKSDNKVVTWENANQTEGMESGIGKMRVVVPNDSTYWSQIGRIDMMVGVSSADNGFFRHHPLTILDKDRDSRSPQVIKEVVVMLGCAGVTEHNLQSSFIVVIGN
jgi:hypothetical protein